MSKSKKPASPASSRTSAPIKPKKPAAPAPGRTSAPTDDRRAAPPAEQLEVSVTGLRIKVRGYVLMLLALGIAAALGAGVVIKVTLF